MGGPGIALAVVDPERRPGFDGMDGIAAVGELPARDDVALACLFEVQHGPGGHGAVQGNTGEVAAYLPALIGEARRVAVVFHGALREQGLSPMFPSTPRTGGRQYGSAQTQRIARRIPRIGSKQSSVAFPVRGIAGTGRRF